MTLESRALRLSAVSRQVPGAAGFGSPASGAGVRPHSACHFWKARSRVFHSLAVLTSDSVHVLQKTRRPFPILAGFSALGLWSDGSKVTSMKTPCRTPSAAPGPRRPPSDSAPGLLLPHALRARDRRVGGLSTAPPSAQSGACRTLGWAGSGAEAPSPSRSFCGSPTRPAPCLGAAVTDLLDGICAVSSARRALRLLGFERAPGGQPYVGVLLSEGATETQAPFVSPCNCDGWSAGGGAGLPAAARVVLAPHA